MVTEEQKFLKNLVQRSGIRRGVPNTVIGFNDSGIPEATLKSSLGGGGVNLKDIGGNCNEWWVYDEMLHPLLSGVLVHWQTNPTLPAGTFAVPVANGGVVSFGTATGNSNNAVNLQTCAGAGVVVIDGGKFLFRARIQTPDATGSILYVGGMQPQFPQGNNSVILATAETDINDGLFFRFFGNVDTNYQCVTENGGSQTIVDSGVAIDNNYHCFDIESDGTNAVFKIDDNIVADITTNIPSGTPLIVGSQINSLATIPSNNRLMNIDFFFVYSLGGRQT